MLRTLIDRPLSSLRTVNRAIHISSRSLSTSTSVPPTSNPSELTKPKRTRKPKDPNAEPKKAPKAKKPKPHALTLDQQTVLPELDILVRTRELEHNQTISLEDVERYRPKNGPPPLTDPAYATSHRTHAKALSIAFNKPQLHDILLMYGLKSDGPKHVLVAELLNEWGWPDPCRPSKVNKTIPMKSSDAFHVINNERILRFVRANLVQLNFSPATQTLTMNGPPKAIDELKCVIESLKLDITETSLTIPFKTTFTKDQLRNISRSTGAVVEQTTHDGSNFRIVYNASLPQSLFATKQAIVRVGYLNAVSPPERLTLVESSADEDSSLYSLSPFVPLQTVLETRKGGSTYRLARNDDPSTEVPETKWNSTLAGLRHWFRHLPNESASAKFLVDAVPGHQVYYDQESSPLEAAFEASHDLRDSVDRLHALLPSGTTFYPFVPKMLLGLETLSAQTYQRLTYSALDTAGSDVDASATSILRVLVMSNEEDSTIVSGRYPEFDASTEASSNPAPFNVLCSKGWSAHLDLLLPNHETDVRFTVSHMEKESSLPSGIQTYLNGLNAPRAEGEPFTNPPLHLYLGSKLYVLTSSDIVRGGLKEVDSERLSNRIITEVVLETETNRSTSACHVSAQVDRTDESWNHVVEKTVALVELSSSAGLPHDTCRKGQSLD